MAFFQPTKSGQTRVLRPFDTTGQVSIICPDCEGWRVTGVYAQRLCGLRGPHILRLNTTR
jgi:hypothetical protein